MNIDLIINELKVLNYIYTIAVKVSRIKSFSSTYWSTVKLIEINRAFLLSEISIRNSAKSTKTDIYDNDNDEINK